MSSFNRLRYPALVRWALAVCIVAGPTVASQGFTLGDAASRGVPAFAAGAVIAQTQDATTDKPKRKSKTRKPTPCGPGSSLPDCPTDGKSSRLSLALPV